MVMDTMFVGSNGMAMDLHIHLFYITTQEIFRPSAEASKEH